MLVQRLASVDAEQIHPVSGNPQPRDALHVDLFIGRESVRMAEHDVFVAVARCGDDALQFLLQVLDVRTRLVVEQQDLNPEPDLTPEIPRLQKQTRGRKLALVGDSSDRQRQRRVEAEFSFNALAPPASGP